MKNTIDQHITVKYYWRIVVVSFTSP